jgi:ribosome-binding factor A
MSVDRILRLNELLRREIGQALFRLINDADFDISAVTVTHVEVSRDLRDATVRISIRDHKDDREKMLTVIRSHRSELQAQVARNIKLKYTPRLIFRIDPSVEQGDRILSLLLSLEEPVAGTAQEPAPADAGEA